MGHDVIEVVADDALAGITVRIHNSLWPCGADDDWEPNGFSTCTVVGACVQPFVFSGNKPANAYIIDYDGDKYPIKKSALLKQLPREAAPRKGRSARGTKPRTNATTTRW